MSSPNDYNKGAVREGGGKVSDAVMLQESAEMD